MGKHALWKSTEFSSTKDVRVPKSNTDTTSELLKPKIVEDLPGKIFERKQLQAKYYDISAKELPPLSNGEVVRVKPTDKSGQWYKARVKKQVHVRSYDVRTDDGRVSRRNKRHPRSSKAPVCSSSNPVSLSMPDGTFTAPLRCCRETQHKCKSCRCFNIVYACKASGFASYWQWSDLQAT